MMPREYFKGTWQEDRSFSPAVVTRAGKMVWLAGVGMWRDEEGNSLAGAAFARKSSLLIMGQAVAGE
ncbi:MAG: hypothetical protein QF701_10000, partial [Nitrospinota bacterium]|nr:hypothetical protein [Nitrospinota bacterium]